MTGILKYIYIKISESVAEGEEARYATCLTRRRVGGSVHPARSNRRVRTLWNAGRMEERRSLPSAVPLEFSMRSVVPHVPLRCGGAQRARVKLVTAIREPNAHPRPLSALPSSLDGAPYPGLPFCV